MRLRGGFAVLALTIAGCGSSLASSQARTGAPDSAACGPAGAQTVASNQVARIYDRNGAVYGCSTRTGRTFRLGSSTPTIGQGRVQPTALAGADAAYGLTSHGVDTATTQVVVRRLGDGKVLHTAVAVSRNTGAESFQSVTALVVKSDGAVAWIGGSRSIGGRQALEVHRIDSRGQAVLDRGAGIAPRSLRLRSSRLSWLDSGRQRSAALR
jgi:hypothetical protein